MAWLVGGLVTTMIVLYLSLGLFTTIAASCMPIKVEKWLGEKISLAFAGEENEFLQQQLDRLVASLPPDSPLHNYSLKIYINESDEINAFALPGGTIIVFAGLLDKVKSENELNMVIAHELGHFAHRDHLRSMGRSLTVSLAAMLIFGEQTSGNAILWLNNKVERKYSQQQETAADTWALDLLNRRYGHVGGATDFFARIAQKDKGELSYFLATHPSPANRIKNINQLIKENHYQVKEVVEMNINKPALR